MCLFCNHERELKQKRSELNQCRIQIDRLKKQLLCKKDNIDNYDLYDTNDIISCPVCIRDIFTNNYVKRTKCCNQYIHSHCHKVLILSGYDKCILCCSREPY